MTKLINIMLGGGLEDQPRMVEYKPLEMLP
jgi:hypothetical protein